jgi:hypothetical protein
VVPRDVPPYAIVGGNPAKVIRYRFEEAQIAALLDSAWWELPEPDVARLAPLLQSTEIDDLVAAVRRVKARPGSTGAS